MYTYTDICVELYTNICVYIYIYTHLSISLSLYVCIYIYIYIHIHIQQIAPTTNNTNQRRSNTSAEQLA